jgi:hypothetical protein
LLLGQDCLQNISRFGNVREVNLWLYAIGIGTRGTAGFRTLAVARALQNCADFVRFKVFKRTGMRFLLGDANFGQHIENGFAFYFQLSCQIVNSNLTHPPLCPSGLSR